VDRYTINGQFTDAIVAAREIDTSAIPEQTWNNIHTVYTHGYAMVAAYGNQREASGEPVWIVGDIPPSGALAEHQARIYYGERTKDFAVVGATPGEAPVELDYPGGGTASTETRNTYDGTGGVSIGNVFNRLLYAIKYTDINLLLSDRVNADSKILYDRTPTQRVQKVAPWLTVDSDPFPAIVDGRLTWILDGYTTSSDYPNSQHVSMSGVTGNSSASGDNINYIRNSVKATVDALNGTVTLYAWDDSDPILQTWEKVFPGLLKPKSDISSDLMNHLRYPTDLFKIQRQILGKYHVTNTLTWYQNNDLWQIPADPRNSQKQEQPYYLSIKWPGDDSTQFSMSAVYVPKERQNLGAFISVVADASKPDYGQIRVLRLSDSQQIAGPAQTFNAIQTDSTVADMLLPYQKTATTVIYGNLLTLPLGGGLIYVEPIYTQRQDSGSGSGAYPLLRYVAVRFGEKIGVGSTLQEALDSVFGGSSGASTGEEVLPDDSQSNQPSNSGSDSSTGGSTSSASPSAPSSSGTGSSTGATGTDAAKQDLQDASAAYTAAQTALKNGDLATYQQQINIMNQKLQAAQQALG
jgi:uncharacterized membrane protein (UPF0182 family)